MSNWSFIPSFIGSISKDLFNSLELPLWHIVTSFLQSTDCAHFYIPSNKLKIVCYILVFYNSILLQLYILLSHWSCLVVVPFPCVVLWNWDLLHHVSMSLLNMLYIIYPSSNFIWNASYPIFFVISKGLYLFWFSFFKSHFDWIFLAFNYTLSSCFNSWEFCFFLSNCFFMASFAFSIDIFVVSQLLCSFSRKVSSFGNSVFIVRSPFHEYCPKLSSNRVYSVAKCFLSLYWNSTTNNHSIQSSF